MSRLRTFLVALFIGLAVGALLAKLAIAKRQGSSGH